MTYRIGINGFGRIGRLIFRAIHTRQDFRVLAINDLSDPHTLAHMLKYDTVFGRFSGEIRSTDNSIIVNDNEIKILKERDPAKLPWKELEIDTAIESTGVFTKMEDCMKHIQAGAKKCLLSAPAKDPVDITVCLGVNHTEIRPEHKVISNASCTTNCLAPVVKVLNDNFGIERGLVTTVHAYTNDQRTSDQIHTDLRRARSAAQNIIPTTTGAARAIALVIPELKGKLDGMAMRVPVVDGSVIDLVAETRKSTTVADINKAMKEASAGPLSKILEYTEDPIVSSDIIGNASSAVFDGKSTMVLGNNLVKVVAWYDNEWAYSNRCVDVIYYLNANKLPPWMT